MRLNPPPKELKYKTDGNNWFLKVFKSDYDTIVSIAKLSELMRFWLLGTWIANELKKDFYLINIVRSGQEEQIEKIFKKHIAISQINYFKRITWEDMYQNMLNSNLSVNKEKNKEIMMKYFLTKALYVNGKIQNAFNVEDAKSNQNWTI